MTRSLVASFTARAAAQPGAPALIWEDRPVSYGDLYAMAARARTQVEEAAPDADRPVGLLVRKSPQAVALVLGCLMAAAPSSCPRTSFPRHP
ncbi:AMP-binding protein [Streptomyces microflavus]